MGVNLPRPKDLASIHTGTARRTIRFKNHNSKEKCKIKPSNLSNNHWSYGYHFARAVSLRPGSSEFEQNFCRDQLPHLRCVLEWGGLCKVLWKRDTARSVGEEGPGSPETWNETGRWALVTMDYNSWSKCGEVQNQKLKRTGWWKGILDQPFEIIWINRLSMLYQTTMPNSRQIFPFAFEKILDKVCRNCGAFQFFSHDYVFRGRRVMLRWHYLRCSNWIPIGTILLSHDNDIFMLYTFDSFGCLHIQEEMLMIFWPIPFHAHIRAQEFHQSHSCSW